MNSKAQSRTIIRIILAILLISLAIYQILSGVPIFGVSVLIATILVYGILFLRARTN